MKPDFMVDLYTTRDYEFAAFGEHWCGPFAIPREWTLVARYPSYEKSDGQSVDVYCAAYPARFYKLDVLPGKNSIGELKAGYTVGTGSGQHRLAAELAEKISIGMIGFHP